MGAYLSTPNREKDSVDYADEILSYGASSMQGWRISQEDAHNCCPDFDKENKASLFAVYDGHGGAEVAQYTAQNFPDFILKSAKYKEGAMAQALEDDFISFDETLTRDDVIETLKELAGVDEPEEDEEEQKEEVAGLCEEAEMPIEQLMERYGAANKTMDALRAKGDKFQSPALRGKATVDKTEAEHIKQNMSNKLLNGDPEEKPVANGHNNVDIKSSPAKQSPKKEEQKTNTPTKTDSKASDITNSGASNKTSEDIKPTEDSKSLPDSTNSESEAAVIADSSKPDSAPQHSQSPKVSSSSESPAASSKSEVSSSDVSSAGGSSAGGSLTGGNSAGGSSAGGSTAGGSSAGGSSAGGSAGGSSSSATDEPSSSTGRKRSGRKGVIPEEGEDESSFDEDEETTDEEDELDEEDITESDSEDEDMAGFRDEEEEEDDEEETDIVYGGEEPGSDSGCTAVVAIMRGNELFVANAGDSRCIVCRDGKAIDMSIDHKPEDELERKRIEKAGGKVTEDNRVNGGLNLSRALGDHVYKRNKDLPLKEQMISPLPDVKSLTLTEQDEFLVLACDGIWNVMTSQDVCVFVRDRLRAGVTKLSNIVEEMFDFCMAPDTHGDGTGCDNMTCIIVKLNHAQPTSGTSAASKRPAEDQSDQSDAKKTKDDGE